MPVQADRAGYEHSKFKHWTDADKDGCNTRVEVLLEEAVVAPVQGPNCALTGGSWYSPYDDRYFDAARLLDVDHLVPLAEAWDSGASAWTAKEREAHANDLDDARALIAASAASNRSKADKGPSEWLPSTRATAASTSPTGSPTRPATSSPSTRPRKPHWPSTSAAARTSRSQ